MEKRKSVVEMLSELEQERIRNQQIQNPHSTQRRSNYALEISFFLIFVAWNLSSAIFTHKIIYQSCLVFLNRSVTDCSALGAANQTDDIKDIEKQVQPIAANIQMIKTICETIFPAVINLFVGPWSDKFGRKPVILISTFGYFLLFLSYTILSICSNYMPINPWYYLFGSAFIALTGGGCTLGTAVFSYVADRTSDKTRDLKMSYLEASVYFGLFCGGLSSSYILKLTSVEFVFGLSTLSVLISFIYACYGIQEVLENNELQPKSKFRELFRLDLIRDLYETCTKQRQDKDRTIIYLIISALVANVFVLNGTSPIIFLFFRMQLKWTVKDFTLFESTTILAQFLGSVIGTYIILKYISGATLSVIAMISHTAHAIIHVVVQTTLQMYLGISITFLKATGTPMLNSMLTKVVDSDEVGKIFSLKATFESFTPLIAAPLYSKIYNLTLHTYPGAVHIISVVIYLYCICAIISAIVLRKRVERFMYVSFGGNNYN